jgi:hypothetical protein
LFSHHAIVNCKTTFFFFFFFLFFFTPPLKISFSRLPHSYVRIDTSGPTEVLAETHTNIMPVLSQTAFKLDPAKGLTLVGYSDDPEKDIGFYAVDVTVRREST